MALASARPARQRQQCSVRERRQSFLRKRSKILAALRMNPQWLKRRERHPAKPTVSLASF